MIFLFSVFFFEERSAIFNASSNHIVSPPPNDDQPQDIIYGTHSFFIKNVTTHYVRKNTIIVFHPFRHSTIISGTAISGKVRKEFLGDTNVFAVYFKTKGIIELRSTIGSSYIFASIFDAEKTGVGCNVFYISVGNTTILSAGQGYSDNDTRSYDLEMKSGIKYCTLFAFVPEKVSLKLQYNPLANVTIFDEYGLPVESNDIQTPVFIRSSVSNSKSVSFHGIPYLYASVHVLEYPYFYGLLDSDESLGYTYTTIDSSRITVLAVSLSVISVISILCIISGIYYMFFYRRVDFLIKEDDDAPNAIEKASYEDRISSGELDSVKNIDSTDEKDSYIDACNDHIVQEPTRILQMNPYEDAEL